MVTRSNHKGLLPNGMMDLLPPSAGQEAEAVYNLLHVFSQFGFLQVKPPFAEFEDSLLSEGSGSALVHNTFRLMDPVSQRMMGLRSDTTMQIARIAASRLDKMPRPLRLSYAADVLRVKGSQLRPERQFVQVGCELIGPDHIEASAEIALLAVLSLHRIGVRGITIDFTIPELAGIILPGQIDALERRERDALKQYGAAGKTLQALMDSAGESKSCLKKLKALTLPPKAKQAVKRLEGVIEMVRYGLQSYEIEKDVMITIDPLERRGFEYQTCPSFTLFAKGARTGELGRGGHYTAEFALTDNETHAESANGFTLYMDSILRILPQTVTDKRIWVPIDTSWHEVRELQDAGWCVIRGETMKPDKKSLQQSLIAYVWQDGKTRKV